jgi:GDP-L-fucose synthase
VSFYTNKEVLVTGGSGLIGRPLVKLLLQQGALVTVASIDRPSDLDPSIKFEYVDLREFHNCMKVCENKSIVFQLAGVKGSPAMTSQRPASFFVPTIQFSINMMEAARRRDVERFLFTSSVGVYSPAEIFHEDDVWSTFPSENDRFAGWAKRMGELQAQAYNIEYNWSNISIVRPANVYGPFDNFDSKNAMVIPSLIRRVIDGERPLSVWGDGSAIRDFIFSEDVARGMLHAVEHGINRPINLGSGTGVTIKEIAETIANLVPGNRPEIVWDTSKPNGDAKRVMDTTRAKETGYEAIISLKEGVRQTIDWFVENKNKPENRYNAFTDKIYL